MVQGLNSLNSINNKELYSTSLNPFNNDYEENIFPCSESDENMEVEVLEEKLASVEKQNGVLLKAWDGIKSAVNIGTSSESCDKAIEQYQNGDISFDEAMSKIEKYDQKQKNSLDLFSNIITSAVAIGAATLAAGAIAATGGTAALALVAIGAGTGAITKAGTKTLERATNEVEGDALNAKQMSKDALSGAVTGGVAVWTAGTAGAPFAKGGTKACIKKCAVTGFESGAVSGAANYTIDCAFEKDKKFNAKDFVETTVVSSAVGGAVGAIMGGVNGTLRATGHLSHGGSVDQATSLRDVVANANCSAAYKALNRGIRDVGAAL